MTRFFVAFIVLIVFSCSNEPEMENTNTVEQKINTHQLFSPSFFIDKDQKSISFPNWFNDTVVKEKQISAIALRSLELNNEAIDSQFVKEEKHFTFKPSGEVKQFSHKVYLEGVVVQNVAFEYKKANSSFGFNAPIISFSSKGFSFNNIRSFAHFAEEMIDYEYYVLEEEQPYYLKFLNKVPRALRTLSFITSPSRQNVKFVDEYLQEQGDSHIVFGTPQLPLESFQLANMVEKEDHMIFEYAKNKPVLHKITSKKQQYYEVKQFFYNEKGWFDFWEAVKYSTDDVAFEKTRFSVSYNSSDLPAMITITNGSVDGEQQQIEKIQITYEFH